eukprot:6191498-Pleurochrysis_carterae.AAC.2
MGSECGEASLLRLMWCWLTLQSSTRLTEVALLGVSHAAWPFNLPFDSVRGNATLFDLPFEPAWDDSLLLESAWCCLMLPSSTRRFKAARFSTAGATRSLELLFGLVLNCTPSPAFT